MDQVKSKMGDVYNRGSFEGIGDPPSERDDDHITI
jgi:hypothetical protein